MNLKVICCPDIATTNNMDPIVLITVQNCGGFFEILRGYYIYVYLFQLYILSWFINIIGVKSIPDDNGVEVFIPMVPSEELGNQKSISGGLHWLEALNENISENLSSLNTSQCPKFFKPEPIQNLPSTAFVSKKNDIVHSLGWAVYPPTEESVKILNDVRNFFKEHIHGKMDEYTQFEPGTYKVRLITQKFNVSVEDIPFINVWIHRDDSDDVDHT